MLCATSWSRGFERYAVLAYLAVVIDLCARRVVGWAMAGHMRTELPLLALTRAIEARRPSAGLIHHSDRGSRYASTAYRWKLRVGAA